MKTSVIEVRDMLSVLSVPGVENLIGKVPGVESVTLNHAAGNATVRYDETRLEIADIKSAVRQLANENAEAPAVPSKVSKPSPVAAPAAPISAKPKTPPDAAAVAPPADMPEGHEKHKS